MTEFEEDLYAILQVEETATPEEIRKAYLKLAKKLHPDRYPNDEAGRARAQEDFRRVTQAHYVLGDADRKAEYDNIRELARKRRGLAKAEPAAGDDRDMQAPAETGADSSTDTINIKWANKHLSRSDEAFRKRRYQEAETAIKEAIRLVPENPHYHTKLAEIYLARNWCTYAMTEVQTALRLDPKNPEAKNLETRIKAITRERGQSKTAKKGFFEQLKDLLGKKI